MPEQTIPLLAAWSTSTRGLWQVPAGSRPEVVAALWSGSEPRYLGYVQVISSGLVDIRFASPEGENVHQSGDDLSDEFEANGSITLTAGGGGFTASLAGADVREPYTWIPANSAEVTAFHAGLPQGDVAGVLVLRDFVPVYGDAGAFGWSASFGAATGAAGVFAGDAGDMAWSAAFGAAMGRSTSRAYGDAGAFGWSASFGRATGNAPAFAGDAGDMAWSAAFGAAMGRSTSRAYGDAGAFGWSAYFRTGARPLVTFRLGQAFRVLLAPPAPAAAGARFRRAVRALARDRDLLQAIVIEHPKAPAPARIVNRTSDAVLGGLLYAAGSFASRLPNDEADRPPRAQIVMPFAGREMAALLDATDGGIGARIELSEWSVDPLGPAAAPGTGVAGRAHRRRLERRPRRPRRRGRRAPGRYHPRTRLCRLR